MDNSANILSPFHVIDTQILNFSFWTSEILDGNTEHGMSIGEGFELSDTQPDNGRIRYQLNLKVSINDYKDDESFNLAIRIAMRGLFSTPTPSDEDKDRAEEWARTNAIAFLYSQARAQINLFSRATATGSVYLPAIDPVAYIMASEPRELAK